MYAKAMAASGVGYAEVLDVLIDRGACARRRLRLRTGDGLNAASAQPFLNRVVRHYSRHDLPGVCVSIMAVIETAEKMLPASLRPA